MKMYYRDANVDVEVYQFDMLNSKALIYNPQLAGAHQGNGWVQVKFSRLIPYPEAEIYKIEGMSKTKRNKAKSRLTLAYAEWVSSDGSIYDHNHLEDAIKHELELMEKGD